MSELLCLHQTFTDCMCNQNTHFDISICQMWLQVMEGPLILLCSIFWTIWLHQTFTNCMLKQKCRDEKTLCKHLWLRQSSFDFRDRAGRQHCRTTEKTTGKPINWIICFSPVLSKVFLQKSLTIKIMKFVVNLKKSVLGPAVYNPLRGYPQRRRFRSWWTLSNDTLRSKIRLVAEKLY